MVDYEPRGQRLSERPSSTSQPGTSHAAAPPAAVPGKRSAIGPPTAGESIAAPRPPGTRRTSPRTPEEERRFVELFGGAPESRAPESRLLGAGGAGAAAGARPLPRLDLGAGGARASAGAAPGQRSAVSPARERQLLEYLERGVAPAVQFENLLFFGLDPDEAIELYARLSADPPRRGDRLAAAFHARLSAAERASILARLAAFNLAASGERMWSELAPGEASQPMQLVSRVDAPKGVFLRSRPAGPKDGPWLPFDTLVAVTRKTERGWYWVTALGDDAAGAAPTGVSGFIEGYHVASKMPEPSARLYEVQPGDLLKDIAARYYKHNFKWGHDARVYVQAIYHANQDRDAVFRRHAELGVDRSALSTTNLQEALALWRAARVVAGQALWIPSEPFVQQLKVRGVIDQASISKMLWDATAGALESAIDRAQYAGGFAVGLLEGAWGALADLLIGAVDVIKALWTVIKGVFTGFSELLELAGKLGAAWERRSDLLTAFATDFMAKWKDKDDWRRGSFQGEVVGYLTMLMFLVYVTAGAGAAVAGSGRFGSFVKVIQLADAAGSFGTYVRKLRAAIKLPQQLADDAAQALGSKLTKPATSSGGTGGGGGHAGGGGGSGHAGVPQAPHTQPPSSQPPSSQTPHSPSSQAPRSPDAHGPRTPDAPALRNRGEPYGDPRVHPEQPHRHLEQHELIPTSELKFATTWKQAAKLLEKNLGAPIGRKLQTASEGHDLVARLARGDASALKQLGIDDAPRTLDTTGREWALIEARDGFVIVVGRYGKAELPAGTRALAHSHPGTTPAHPLGAGEHLTIDLPVPAGGKTFTEILTDLPSAAKAGITPSVRDIHAISDGGEHVIYTRFVHRGDGKIGNPGSAETAARVNLHLAGARVVRFNQRTQEYWYRVDLHVKDSTNRSLWRGELYAYWMPQAHDLAKITDKRPPVLDRALPNGWQQP